MANKYNKPGIALVFNDEIWFIPAKDYDDVTRKIEEIKDTVVGPNSHLNYGATKLNKGDYVALTELETEDMKSLLTKGITIRPLGR